jgi:hypothetical protein
LFRYGEGIIDLDTEVPDSAFDLGVTEQELHGWCRRDLCWN